jgi:glycosyltransferase involved in cell wall biosynthesis
MNDGGPMTVLIVPCFNEGARLQPEAFLEALESHPTLFLLFVDDGSTDNTFGILQEIQRGGSGRVHSLRLNRNRGKAEAIRQGVLSTFETGTESGTEGSTESGPAPEFLGYWDADLSTPLNALPLFLEAFEENPDCRLVMGSRVKLLGRNIVRKPFRHYAGRVMATVASLALDLPVYDTQCGAKLFRIDPSLKDAFERPFSDPWIFDVELLARLRALWGSEAESRIIELPLPSWEHVGGSKVRMWDGVRALWGLAFIWIRRVRGGGHGRMPN